MPRYNIKELQQLWPEFLKVLVPEDSLLLPDAVKNYMENRNLEALKAHFNRLTVGKLLYRALSGICSTPEELNATVSRYQGAYTNGKFTVFSDPKDFYYPLSNAAVAPFEADPYAFEKIQGIKQDEKNTYLQISAHLREELKDEELKSSPVNKEANKKKKWQTVEDFVEAQKLLLCLYMPNDVAKSAAEYFNKKPDVVCTTNEIQEYKIARITAYVKLRNALREAMTAEEAQELRSKIKLTSTEKAKWDEVRFNCMEYAVTEKFKQNPKLYDFLRLLHGRIPVENSKDSQNRRDLAIILIKLTEQRCKQQNWSDQPLFPQTLANVPELPLTKQFIDSIPSATFEANSKTGCQVVGSSTDPWESWTTTGTNEETSPQELLVVAKKNLNAARRIAQAQTNQKLARSLRTITAGEAIPYAGDASPKSKAPIAKPSTPRITIDSRDFLGFAPLGTKIGGNDEVDKQHYFLVISQKSELAPGHGEGVDKTSIKDIAIRSNYLAVMDRVKTDLGSTVNTKTAGALYGSITVFRGAQGVGFPLLEEKDHRKIHLIVMPPVDCKQDDIKKGSLAYYDLAKQKIRHCLRISKDKATLSDEGPIKNIVFANIEELMENGADAEIIALSFLEVLKEQEFQTGLESIVFRIPTVEDARKIFTYVFNSDFGVKCKDVHDPIINDCVTKIDKEIGYYKGLVNSVTKSPASGWFHMQESDAEPASIFGDEEPEVSTTFFQSLTVSFNKENTIAKWEAKVKFLEALQTAIKSGKPIAVAIHELRSGEFKDSVAFTGFSVNNFCKIWIENERAALIEKIRNPALRSAPAPVSSVPGGSSSSSSTSSNSTIGAAPPSKGTK